MKDKTSLVFLMSSFPFVPYERFPSLDGNSDSNQVLITLTRKR